MLPIVYLINLDKSTDRLEKSQQRLNEQSILFERVPGILGSALTDEQVSEHYDEQLNKQNYHYQLTRNQIGCYLSHRKAWMRIAEGEAPFGVVLEDDFYLPGNLQSAIDEISKLSFSWDLIKLAAYQNRQRNIKFAQELANNMQLVVHTKPMSGGAATAISKPAAKKLLEATEKFGRPVDTDIQHFWEKGITVLSLLPYPVAQDMTFESTIAAGSEKHTKFFWRRKWQQLSSAFLNARHTQKQIESLQKSLK